MVYNNKIGRGAARPRPETLGRLAHELSGIVPGVASGTFSEICGQDAVVRTLRRQVVSGRIAHAYLFCGTRGTGKTTASKVLARAINCLHPVDGDPCGECEICRMLKSETCMDVVEIDAASTQRRGRDPRPAGEGQVSAGGDEVQGVHRRRGAHALHPARSTRCSRRWRNRRRTPCSLLATTEPHRLPATILSRCQRFDFHRISVDVIVARLKVVLSASDAPPTRTRCTRSPVPPRAPCATR